MIGQEMNSTVARIVLFLVFLICIGFAFLMAIITFWYPLSYFRENDISSWIGIPVTLILTIIGTYIGAMPFTYISHQRKSKTGLFGRLQIMIDASRK